MSLWLCLYLPYLPLEALIQGSVLTQACVVSAGQNVLLATQQAQDMGIVPGMRLSAARVLGEIIVLSQSPRQEQAALQSLAVWSGQFTSKVSLEAPAALLLEVGGSLTLFGGVAILHERISQGLNALGYQARLAVAPTPTAALLLARAGVTRPVLQLDALETALDTLPLQVLGLSARENTLLTQLGITTLGACWRLPRAGFIRRFGKALRERLDHALGLRQEVRTYFEPPAVFQRQIELLSETASIEALQFVARRLLVELTGFLRGRGMGVQVLQLTLVHADRRSTPLRLGLVAAACDVERFCHVLRERLARLTLAEPVRAIALRVDQFEPYLAQTNDLFGEAVTAFTDRSNLLLERLRARLGHAVVQGIAIRADHRPESAWQCCEPGASGVVISRPARPVWLYAQPQAIAFAAPDGKRVNDKRFACLPERIQSAWWDKTWIQRDYYIAQNHQGLRLWIYQELHKPGHWYVHGIFA